MSLDISLAINTLKNTVAGSGLAAGASTSAILNSLQTETDGFVINMAQGNSGVIRAVDSTDTNTLTVQELTQSLLDILDYASPSIKMVTGPDGNLRYAAHNIHHYSENMSTSYWTKNASTATAGEVTATGSGAYIRADAQTFLVPGPQMYEFEGKAGANDGALAVCLLSGFDVSADGTSEFDLLNGTVYTEHANHTCTIDAVEDGYFRCRIFFTTTTDLTGTNRISVRTAADGVSGDGDSLFLRRFAARSLPCDYTYLKVEGTTPRYAIPQTHSPVIYDTSSTAISIGLGIHTFTTATSAKFTPGQNIKAWVDDDNWMSGTVIVQNGTTLMITADHIKGSGEHSSWHLSKIIGALIEPAATNICLQSQDYSATWSIGGSADVTNDQAAAPDGTTTAAVIADDNGGGTGEVTMLQNVTVATSTQYTYSFYVKQKQSTWIGLTLAGFTTPTTTTAYFDLANGVQGSQATATAADAIRMEKCRDDWYRCSITFTTDAADTTGSVRVYVADGDGDFTVDRDGTSDLYIWGAQLETGSRPTSYIHTVGSSVTRARDDIGKDLAELPFADAAPGTFVFAGEVEDASRTQYTWTMNDSSHDNRYTQFFSSGNINNYIADGGAAQHNASVGAGRDGANFKASLAWDTNDAQGCLNGVLNTQDTSVVLPSGLNILELGQWGAGGASNQMSGVMSYCKFLTRRVPNAGLQTDTEVSYSGLEGASTLKLANSLREETDVAVWNWKQMRVHIKDTSTPGNNKNTVAITDEIVDYASPSVKRVTGPDRLLKYAAQNVIQYSEDLSNAYWTKNAFASTAQNAVTRPDGTLTGQRISLSALAAGQQRFFNSMTVPSGRVRVYVELKLSSDKTWAYIRLNNTTAAHHVWYNLRTGVLGTTQGSVHVGDITSLGDDWYGCEIVTDGSGAAGNLVVGVSDSDNVTTSTSVGGETVDIGKLIVQQHPAQDIYLKTTTVARYAIPCDHDAATYTTSTTAATLALGTLTLTTADSAEFTAGQDICGSDQSDPHGKYWTGTVTSHSGTTLVVNVDHFEGSGSVSSWHLIKIEGVLVEPAATNLQPYSQEFSNAVYTKTVTVTDNTDTAPDGTTTADTIEDDNAAGFENLVDANTIPDDSLDYTFSIFVLKDSDETRFPELRLALQGGTSQYRYFQFNTATGATSSTGSAGTSTYTVEDYGLYWRVIVTVTNNSSGNTSALWTLYPAISMSLGSGSNLAATGSIIIWGAQLEQSSVPTSYIHTPSTASVTRAADDLSQATSEFAFKDGQAGSHIMSVNIRDASSQVHAVNYNDGSAANRVLMYTSSSSIRGYMDAASVNQANASAGALSDNTDHKIGVVWGAGRLIAARDENLSAEDTSVTLLSGVTGVNFGASEAHVAQINGHVKYDVYRPRDLSNADLQLETT